MQKLRWIAILPLLLALPWIVFGPAAAAEVEKAGSSVVAPASFRPLITEKVIDRPQAGSCQVPATAAVRSGLLLAQNGALPRDSYGLPGHPPDKRAGQRALAAQPLTKGERAASLNVQRITAIEPTTCDPPVARTQFAPTDSRVWHFFSVTSAAAGDTVVWDWYRPDGTRHDSTRLTLSLAGSVCMWAGLNIAGTSAVEYPGTWTVRIVYNNANLASTTFTLAAASSGGGSGGTITAGTRVCRLELSSFYQGAHSLGTAWVRPVVESSPMSGRAVSQIQGALDNLIAGLNAIPCISFDRAQITRLSSRIPSLSPDDAIRETETVIRNLQSAIRATSLACDNGVNLESLYVTGVHLGAAIAWSTGFLCDDELSPGVTDNVEAHLEAAREASAAYRACSFNFHSDLFTTPDLSAPPNEIFTQLMGLYNLYLWNISLSDCCCTCGASSGGSGGGTGTIAGTVRNASNGQVLSGARVAVAGTSLTATTAADGTYTLREVPAGAQRLEASATGFISNSINVTVAANQTLTQNISLSPTLQTGEIRITLNWTKTNGEPNDLDMHLIAPVPNSTTCAHIYYSSKGSRTASPFAELEVDNINVTGDPPTETIRISRLTPGIYRFYVHNYSGNNTSELTASRAAVQVFGASGQIFSQSVPSGTGYYWSVFTMDGTTGAITPVGTVSSASPPSTCR